MRRLFVLLLGLAMLAPGMSTSGATPRIVDLPDTPLTSPNVHLVTTLPIGEAVGGHFAEIGGKMYYFATTAKPVGYTYYSYGDGGVWAFDVTNPEQPVVAGHIPLPVWQNEDVDLSAKRGLLFFVMDNARAQSTACSNVAGNIDNTTANGAVCTRLPAILFTINISNPMTMKILSTFQLPAAAGTSGSGASLRSAGHTASCVLDCNYVYVSGHANGTMAVVDLRDPAAPKLAGSFASPAGTETEFYNAIHDANVDKFGNMWAAGAGGTAMYAKITNPLKPKLLAAVSPADNAKTDQLIHHGVQRLNKNVVLIGEEQFVGTPANAVQENSGFYGDCGGKTRAKGAQDGRFQTWSIDLKAKRLRLLDMWDTELQDGSLPAYESQTVGIGCSSHWFTVNKNNVVADGWYEQGLRFLDVSNPKKIKQVGYYMGPLAAASEATYVPGHPDLVYVADYVRGIDVVRIDNGGKGATQVRAPIRAEWFKDHPGNAFLPKFKPDETFGYACMVPKT